MVPDSPDYPQFVLPGSPDSRDYHRLSGGAANRAVLAAVAGHFDLPVSSVRLRSGARSRTKLVEVDSVVEAGSED